MPCGLSSCERSPAHSSKAPGGRAESDLDWPSCHPMKARQSVTHPFSFPMEAGRRGGSKEANLVEWPLKQQSAVNMLWCHAPNAHRAYCPRCRERTFAPVSHFAKWPCAGGVSLQTKSGVGGSLFRDLNSDGQLLDIDLAQRLTVNWTVR